MACTSVFDMVKGYTVTNEERNTVRAKLKQWLEEDGYTVKVLDGKTTYFTLGIEHPTLRVSLTVGQLLGHKDRITILGALSISELHRQKLEELSENQRNEFLWDLKFTLVSNDIPFEMPPRGRASGQLAELDLLPDQIIVSQAVWYDGLTKDSFMRRFHQAVKGMFLVLLKFEHLSGASVFKDEYSKYVV